MFGRAPPVKPLGISIYSKTVYHVWTAVSRKRATSSTIEARDLWEYPYFLTERRGSSTY